MVWSRDRAYVVGLITTDGCLSKDKRHIDFTSKDLEQILNFKKILKLKNKIGIKYARKNKIKKYYRIQFGDIKLYEYLVSIGLTPRKSKTLKAIKVPDRYFPDFLRGCFDGDGYSYSGWSKQWQHSFIFYTGFCSASIDFLNWMREKIKQFYKIKGYIKQGNRSEYMLMFAKANSLKLVEIIYYSEKVICLTRKKFKIDQTLGIIQSQAGML